MSDPLQTATRELIGARTDPEIRRAATRAMNRLLDADRCTLTTTEPACAGARQPDSGGRDTSRDLREAATRRSAVGNAVDPPGGAAGPFLVDDLETEDVEPADLGVRPVTRPDGRYRSLLGVPVADGRALVALDRQQAAFAGDDLEAIADLAACVEAALERVAAAAGDRDAADRMTEIANVLSHDVQNSLTIAAGHLRLARDDHDDEHLERVDVAHERIGELVDDVITLARTGDRVERIEPVAVSTAVERAWSNVETPAVRIRVVESPTIRADESSLRQLLENLFRNAVEHGSTSPRSGTHEDAVEHGSSSSCSAEREDASQRAGTEVTVRVGALEDGDGFYVADDGPGIPRAERQQVFVSGHTTSADGTGFGLSIVRRIADVHGWDVAVTESATGGARFEFSGVETESTVAHP